MRTRGSRPPTIYAYGGLRAAALAAPVHGQAQQCNAALPCRYVAGAALRPGIGCPPGAAG